MKTNVGDMRCIHSTNKVEVWDGVAWVEVTRSETIPNTGGVTYVSHFNKTAKTETQELDVAWEEQKMTIGLQGKLRSLMNEGSLDKIYIDLDREDPSGHTAIVFDSEAIWELTSEHFTPSHNVRHIAFQVSSRMSYRELYEVVIWQLKHSKSRSSIAAVYPDAGGFS